MLIVINEYLFCDKVDTKGVLFSDNGSGLPNPIYSLDLKRYIISNRIFKVV